MDAILSEFVARTSTDPGLAADLLNAHDWNLQSALSVYYVMKGILPGEVPPSDLEYASLHGRSVSSSSWAYSLKNDGKENFMNDKESQHAHVTSDKDDDETNNMKLTRGISRATDNLRLVTKTRREFSQDLGTSESYVRKAHSILEIPDYTFTLPDFTTFPESLRDYLQKDLIETSTLVSLEQAGRLNWWHVRKICQKLWPLATTGDGNCLLHAASLGTWGFHDRLLTLRKALHSFLTNSMFTNAFYRRWRWQTTLVNKEAGLIYCEEEWQNEWQNILKMSSSEPRQTSRGSNEHMRNTSNGYQANDCHAEVYESLEELHVLALAHVLKRPIIVIADTVLKDVTGEPFAPIPFGGIYLPFEYPSSVCHHSPLCLTYDSAHFSALVPMDEEYIDSPYESKAAIPVTDPENRLLPLQFAVDPGPEVKWGQDEDDPWIISRLTLTDKEKLILLNDYLEIQNIEVTYHETEKVVKEKSMKLNGYVPESNCDPSDSDDSYTDGGISCTGGKHSKSKAARQLQTVAKQFGSIGKSMSKKLKHFGNMARRGGSFKGESSTFKRSSESLKNKRTLSGLPMMSRAATVDGSLNPRQVVVAVLNTDNKHEYQKIMIENYLSSAIARYEKEKLWKESLVINDKCRLPIVQCVNSGCKMFGTPTTSYLCLNCYKKQKREYEFEGKRMLQKHINGLSDGPVVVSGKSSFYTESDAFVMESLRTLPLGEVMPNGTYREKNSIFYDKYPCASTGEVFPMLVPQSTGKLVSIDTHSGLKSIEESATS